MDDHFLTQVEEITARGRAQDLDFDGVVARVTVDQFCSLARPTQIEIDRFAAVILEALPRADAISALRIAEKLVDNANTPEIVLAGLVERDCAAAAVVFRRAARVSTALLLRRAEIGNCIEAVAIAGRHDLDRPVVAAIARRTEAEALRALAANGAAHIDSGALPGLVQRGRSDAALARALLRRPELGLGALPLFLWADSGTRRRLLVETQRAELALTGLTPSLLDSARLKAMSAARAGNRAAFATAIALTLKAGRAAVDRMIDDDGGEPLALILAATGADTASAADALAMLRPDLVVSDNMRLALAMNAAAAGRIIAAATTGRASVVRHPVEQVRPARMGSADILGSIAPLCAKATKLNLG